MRRRELIHWLRNSRKVLQNLSHSGFLSNLVGAQERERQRMELLHEIELALPEIIEKLEDRP
jgi:hypothetical protein